MHLCGSRRRRPGRCKHCWQRYFLCSAAGWGSWGSRLKSACCRAHGSHAKGAAASQHVEPLNSHCVSLRSSTLPCSCIPLPQDEQRLELLKEIGGTRVYEDRRCAGARLDRGVCCLLSQLLLLSKGVCYNRLLP